MKFNLLSISCAVFLALMAQSVFAAPAGNIVIHNASDDTITAQISSFGKFDLAANQQKNVSYRALAYACSPNPENCTARFYVDNKQVGSAMINAVTGKLVYMKVSMKVRTAKSDQVLRGVVIQ